MRRPRFTLIELLCVMAVIAVLVSLLYPSFLQAMRRAKLVVCVNNFHQMGVGAAMFGRDNKSAMPWTSPNHPVYGTGTLSGHGIESIWSPAYGWLGQGLLWERGYITAPKTFFCPTAGRFTYNSPSGWDASHTINTGHISSSYSWNGMQNYVSGVSWGRWLNAAKDPGNTPMAADIFCPMHDDPQTKPNHPDGFAVLRLDGSAQFVKYNPLTLISRSTNQISYHAMATYGWQGVFK